MRMSEVFPSKWLSGDDLPHDTTVTIARCVLEEVRNPRTKKVEKKPCLYFVNRKKALIVNKTNADTLVALYGDESNEWAGKRVILGSEMVDSPRGQVLAVRVRNVDPDTLVTAPPPAAPEPDEEEEEGES
jgi:hypothetical protein